MGVDHVVDLSHENVTQSIKDFLKARKLKGVDVLFDPVGGKLTKEALRLLNWGAQILVIGFASGEVPLIPANIALVKVRLYVNCNWRIKYFHLFTCCDFWYNLFLIFLLSFLIIFQQNWTVHGLYWGSYRIHRPGVLEDSVRELLSWMARGFITIHISHTYSMSEVRQS